jgi:hypothetical protein
MESCANCERKIGNLETPMLWRNSVVCTACYQVLQAQPAATVMPIAPQIPATKATQVVSETAIRDGVAAGIGKVVVVVLLILFIVLCLAIALAKMN